MKALEFQRNSTFKAPPKEWIDHRLENLFETLDKNTKASALALKDLFGTIEQDPVPGECMIECGRLVRSRGYYMAYSKIDILALLDEYKDTNWSLLRTRSQRVRTIVQVEMKVKIPCHKSISIYQILSEKIKELKALGLTNRDIALKLKINKKTVTKGLRC